MIVAAAIKINNLVLSMARPARHHDIIRQIDGLFDPNPRSDDPIEFEVRGFLTDAGEFLDRKDSMVHVIDCGQGTPNHDAMQLQYPNRQFYKGDELFSEHMW
jgi:hypothetical protein